ncbi:hypothetical protein HOY82DRAFT_609944 [Tuber indicum]|nr:hypothetical protein HOY82DRAFT_609944 [Tuber indicum]
MLTGVDMSVSSVQAVRLAPYRELAGQMLMVAQTMGQFSHIELIVQSVLDGVRTTEDDDVSFLDGLDGAMSTAIDGRRTGRPGALLTIGGIRRLWVVCEGEEDKCRVLTELYRVSTVQSSNKFVSVRDSEANVAGWAQCCRLVATLNSAQEGVDRDGVIDAFSDAKAKVLMPPMFF